MAVFNRTIRARVHLFLCADLVYSRTGLRLSFVAQDLRIIRWEEIEALYLLLGTGMNDDPSLYEKLGGESGIHSLIAAFYVRVLADDELAPFFRGVSIEKLHLMQREFFAMALGGPITYSGRPMGHVHHGRGITARHFSRFVGHLLATLEDLDVSEVESAQVIERINSFANEVTGTSY